MRSLLASLLGFLIAGCATTDSYDKRAEVMLDLRYLGDTDEPAAYICFAEDQCAVHATLYLYEARVRKVITGVTPRNLFRVLYGLHALPKKNLYNVKADLVPITEDRKDRARYKLENAEW